MKKVKQFNSEPLKEQIGYMRCIQIENFIKIINKYSGYKVIQQQDILMTYPFYLKSKTKSNDYIFLEQFFKKYHLYFHYYIQFL